MPRMLFDTPSQVTCRNGHVVPVLDAVPKTCPECGVKLRMGWPIVWGAAFGFLVSIAVSSLEAVLLPYTLNVVRGWLILLAAIPVTLVASGFLGRAYMKSRFKNTIGFGPFLLGTSLVVLVFLMLWTGFLFLLVLLLGCGGGWC